MFDTHVVFAIPLEMAYVRHKQTSANVDAVRSILPKETLERIDATLAMSLRCIEIAELDMNEHGGTQVGNVLRQVAGLLADIEKQLRSLAH